MYCACSIKQKSVHPFLRTHFQLGQSVISLYNILKRLLTNVSPRKYSVILVGHQEGATNTWQLRCSHVLLNGINTMHQINAKWERELEHWRRGRLRPWVSFVSMDQCISRSMHKLNTESEAEIKASVTKNIAILFIQKHLQKSNSKNPLTFRWNKLTSTEKGCKSCQFKTSRQTYTHPSNTSNNAFQPETPPTEIRKDA